MFGKIIAIIVLASLTTIATAQTKVKTHSHYIGLQANQLVRQLFSFGNSNTAVNNPYLLNYSVNSDSTGIGFTLGLGYTMDEVKTGDAIFERNSKINDLALRIGVEKKFKLGSKWMASFGGDIVVDRLSNNTTTKSDTDFNKSTVTTTNKQNGWGFGPRAGLMFQITNRILLGTECTYYFKSITNSNKTLSKSTTREFDPFTGMQREVTHIDKTDDEDDLKRLQLNVPAALFLIVKF